MVFVPLKLSLRCPLACVLSEESAVCLTFVPLCVCAFSLPLAAKDFLLLEFEWWPSSFLHCRQIETLITDITAIKIWNSILHNQWHFKLSERCYYVYNPGKKSHWKKSVLGIWTLFGFRILTVFKDDDDYEFGWTWLSLNIQAYSIKDITNAIVLNHCVPLGYSHFKKMFFLAPRTPTNWEIGQITWPGSLWQGLPLLRCRYRKRIGC